MFARITHVITNEIINNAIYIRKAIGTTVLKLEGIVFFLQIFFLQANIFCLLGKKYFNKISVRHFTSSVCVQNTFKVQF